MASMSAAAHGRRGEWWGELSALPHCYVPSSSGSMYMYVGRKKGILTAGRYGMWWFAVRIRTQFSVSGAFLPKAHFVS